MLFWKNRIRRVQINCAHHKCQLGNIFFFFCFLGIHMQKSKFVPHTWCDLLRRRNCCFNLPDLFCRVHKLSTPPSWRQTEEIHPSLNFLNENLLWVMIPESAISINTGSTVFPTGYKRGVLVPTWLLLVTRRGWAFSPGTEHTQVIRPGVFLWGLHLGQVIKIKNPWEHELHYMWNKFSLILRDPVN